jgi:hypothetical protein
MADANSVAAAMLADLRDETPQVLVLKGRWGCGKSYLWAHHVAPRLTEAKLAVVTTSLFGISSVDELRNRLATGAMFAVPTVLKNSREKFATVKQVGGGAAKQFGKMLGQALDEYAGTSAFASRVDYLELVPEGVVFCIDDVERAGTDVDVRGILGVVNYLVEVKKCRIVLIMDDEKLQEKEKEFQRFKERVVRAVYRLDADVASAFDRLAAATLESHGDKLDLPAAKELVLGTFRRVGHANLRTLDRLLRFLSRVTCACNLPVPMDAVAFSTVLLLEDSDGSLRDRSHYDFSTMLLLFRGDDEGQAAQRKFLNTYYEDISEYQFVGAIYDAVVTGILDAPRLNVELFPVRTPSTDTGRLLAMTQNDDFAFLDDAGYAKFVERASTRLADVDNPLTAREAVLLLGYANFAAGRAKLQWNADVEDHARRHVENAATSDDETLRKDFEPRVFLNIFAYTSNLLDIYQLRAREREARERRESVVVAIDTCNVGALARALNMQWELLRLLTTDAVLFHRVVSSPDVRFRHGGIDVVVRKLDELADTQFPWVPEAKRHVHAALKAAKTQSGEHSESARFDIALRQASRWPALTTGEAPSGSAEPTPEDPPEDDGGDSAE